MGTLERIKRILASNVNELLDSVEDPEKLIKQVILDMDESVKEARRDVALAMATLKKLEKRTEEVEDDVKKWQQCAVYAVQKGKDDMAREALKQKKHYVTVHREFQAETERQREALDRLLPSLKQLEDKVDEMKRRKHVLIAKKKMAQMLPAADTEPESSLKNGEVLDAWSRMVEKIEDAEMSADATGEISRQNDKDLDAEIELLKLKEKMEKGGQ